jgi:PAS domain S-box-containing protein
MSNENHLNQDAVFILNSLLSELPDIGLMAWNEQGRITSLSAQCRELLQLPASASVGGQIGIFGQSPCKKFIQTYERFRDSCGNQSVEEEYELTRDGRPYWLSLRVKRCPESYSPSLAFLLIVRDVTASRVPPDQVRQLANMSDAALRAIPDAVIMTDTAGYIAQISSGAERVSGYVEEELLGKPATMLSSQLSMENLSQEEGGDCASPQVQMINLLTKDGHRISTEAVTDWITDRDDHVLGFIAVLRELSVRNALQEDLLKQALLLDSVFRQVPFALGVIDTNRNIVQMSDSALALFGYRQDEMADHSTRMIYSTQEEFERVGDVFYRIHPGKPVIASLVDSSGRRFQGRVQVAPLYDAQQSVKGYLFAIEDVTESLAYEEELRRYEQIVSASSDALIFIDKRHTYRAANQVYLDLWQKSKTEIVGAHISDIVGEEFYLRYSRPALKRCFNGKSVFFDSIEVTYPVGRRFVDARHTPYRNEQGEITGVLMTLRDVSQRHLSELAMQYSQDRFELAGNFAQFAVWELDAETRQPVEDLMLRRMLGYSAEDPLDSLDDWLAIVPEPDRRRMAEYFEKLLDHANKEHGDKIECRAQIKNGGVIYVETLMEGRIQEGKRRLVGISRNITSLVRDREELRKYEHMTLAASDGLALIDRQHIYQAVNGFYTRYYGRSRESIVGATVSSLSGERYYRHEFRPMLDRCFAGEELGIAQWLDYPQAGRRRMEVSFTPYRDGTGQISRVLVTTHDITDSYLSQIALQESEEKFRAIFDHVPIGVVILAIEDGAILDANPASLSMHGYEREEYLSLKPWEIVVGITPENFHSEWGRVTERRRSRFESEHWRKGGSKFNVLVDASRMQINTRDVIVSTLTDITHLKRLELQLREQQSQYRVLVESSSAILYSADPKTFHFTFVSPEAEHLLGYPVASWIEEPDFWLNHLHPEDRQWAPDYCMSMVAKRKDHDFDYRMIAADGRVVWLHTVTSVIVADETAVSLVGVMVNITAGKEAEAERWRLSEMIQQSADAILLTDTDFKITYINKAFTELYGYDLDDLRGKRPEILNGEADAETIYPQIYKSLLAGREVFREQLNARKDGSLFYCQHFINPLRNDQGDVVAYMSSQRDISVRLETERALRESEEKYRQIVETAHEGIWVVDAQAKTTFVNPRLAEMLGYTEDQMSGRTLFDFLDPSKDELARRSWKRLLQDGKTTVDLLFQRQDGSDLWSHVSTCLMQNKRGNDPLVMALLTDITEQRKLTEALVRSQKMEAVGQLTGGIAHDFNNILGSILGFAELAQVRFGKIDVKLQEYLGQIETAGGRARDLIRQLLVFSRGENTRSASAIPLGPLINEVVKMLVPMLPGAIEIRTELPHEPISAVVDPLHVQQVLMNLCINARDAIDRRGLITVRLTKRWVTGGQCAICGQVVAGDWVSIRVTDSGRGIDESLRDDIFQPFITSKEVGEGSGMGLAVVRGIVNSYYGHLVVESTPGKGTSFEILLPEERAETEHEIPATEPEADLVRLDGFIILTVDDESQFRTYCNELLSDMGAEVVSCQNGMQALGRYCRDGAQFDMIITDQSMPAMSGTEMVKSLRELGCRVPVILCTAYGQEIDGETLQQLDIVELLLKPVSPGELTAAIGRALAL